MKKRTLIIPIAALVILLLFSIAEVCLTTEYTYSVYAFSNRSVADDHRAIANDLNKNIAIRERSYKKSNDFSRLQALSRSCNPEYFVILQQYSGDLSEDYLDKCIKYNQMVVDMCYNNPEVTELFYQVDNDLAKAQFIECLQYRERILWAKYLKGNRKEAMDEFKSIIDTGNENYSLTCSIYFMHFMSYLSNDPSVSEQDRAYAIELKDKTYQSYVETYNSRDNLYPGETLITKDEYFSEMEIYSSSYSQSDSLAIYLG